MCGNHWLQIPSFSKTEKAQGIVLWQHYLKLRNQIRQLILWCIFGTNLNIVEGIFPYVYGYPDLHHTHCIGFARSLFCILQKLYIGLIYSELALCPKSYSKYFPHVVCMATLGRCQKDVFCSLASAISIQNQTLIYTCTLGQPPQSIKLALPPIPVPQN